MDKRQQQLQNWLTNKLSCKNIELHALPTDASFRRYFRIHYQGESLLAMDSPPEREPCDNFIQVAGILQQAGLRVPSIRVADPNLGFLLISDFGDELLLQRANDSNAQQLYGQALDELLTLQYCSLPSDRFIPPFDHDFMRQELENFSHWFVATLLQCSLSNSERVALEQTYDWLIQQALSQPQVFIHRDYHSRNLMVLTNEAIGIIDFQDAMMGPITYDLVSLLRDCYVAWPLDWVRSWVDSYYQRLQAHHPVDFSKQQFHCWFDLMGVQRHLKASFIFARKALRDGDKRYLNDIPRTVNYIQQTARHYPELRILMELFNEKWIPGFRIGVSA